jgi:hypothetical protein
MHLFYDDLGSVFVIQLQLQKPQGAHGNHAGQEMTTDFAINPVEHGVDLTWQGSLLTLNWFSILYLSNEVSTISSVDQWLLSVTIMFLAMRALAESISWTFLRNLTFWP